MVLAGVFLLYSLYGVVSAFGASLTTLGAWAIGMLLSLTAGRRLFGPATVAHVPGTTKIQLPGSWLPLGLMMGIFAAKFTIGFVAGAQVAVGRHPWFAPMLSFLLGALSGGFSSRAVAVRRLLAEVKGPA